jgi:hypothetical protein
MKGYFRITHPKELKIRIKYRKLGKENAYGVAHSDGLIEIDERLKGKKHLEIIVHETLHLLWPEASEEEIEKKAITLTKILWKENYRRIDPHEDIPLQDGSK